MCVCLCCVVDMFIVDNHIMMYVCVCVLCCWSVAYVMMLAIYAACASCETCFAGNQTCLEKTSLEKTSLEKTYYLNIKICMDLARGTYSSVHVLISACLIQYHV